MEDIDDEDGESVDDLLVAYNAAQGTLGWTPGPSAGPPEAGSAAAALLAEKPPAEEAAVLRAMLEGAGGRGGAEDGAESSDWETSSDEGGHGGPQQATHDGDGNQDRRASPRRVPASPRCPRLPAWDPTDSRRPSPPILSTPTATTSAPRQRRRPRRRQPRYAFSCTPTDAFPTPPAPHRHLSAAAFLHQAPAQELPASVPEESTIELAGSVMSVVDRLLVVQARPCRDARPAPQPPQRLFEFSCGGGDFPSALQQGTEGPLRCANRLPAG